MGLEKPVLLPAEVERKTVYLPFKSILINIVAAQAIQIGRVKLNKFDLPASAFA